MGALHVRLAFLVSMSHLQPSDSTICPGNGPKRPPQAPNFVQIGWRQPQTKNRPYLGYMAQNAIPRAPNPPATPLVLWFPPLKIAQMDA